MKRIYIILLTALLALPAAAQEENIVTADIQLRSRGEYNNGATNPRLEGQTPETFINERARLGVGFQRSNLEAKFAIQHTGIWGQDGINTPDGSVAVNEAWAKIRFADAFFVQVGRQQLSYDDERILGGLDWHVSGNWHDALRFGYENLNNKVHLILAFNQATTDNKNGNYYNGPMPYKAMQTVWYHFQSTDRLFGISVLGMNLGREAGEAGDGETKYMQTFGTDISYKPSGFDLHGAFYYQTGRNAADTKVSAWMASLQAGYRINPMWGVNLGYDYRSGNDGKSSKDKSFDQLFGTHHKFYGFMDYFLRTVPSGLQDLRLGATAKFSPKVNMLVNYHYFLTAEKQGNLSKGLGHEVDLQLNVNLIKDVTLQCGYSFMRGTKTMDAIKGGNHKSWQDWAWISLNINPRILIHKW